MEDKSTKRWKAMGSRPMQEFMVIAICQVNLPTKPSFQRWGISSLFWLLVFTVFSKVKISPPLLRDFSLKDLIFRNGYWPWKERSRCLDFVLGRGATQVRHRSLLRPRAYGSADKEGIIYWAWHLIIDLLKKKLSHLCVQAIYLFYMTTFSIVSAIGIGIGLAISESGLGGTASYQITNSALQGKWFKFLF